MNEMPPDPFLNTDLLSMAKSAFEMYSAYVVAGFTLDQALQITISIVTTMLTNAQKGAQ